MSARKAWDGRRPSAGNRAARGRRSLVVPVLLVLAVVGGVGLRGVSSGDVGVEPPFVQQGADHEVWLTALEEAGNRPVRVVVVSDSIGQLSMGFRGVWQEIHARSGGGTMASWSTPQGTLGAGDWPLSTGRPAEVGIDGRGRRLVEGDGPSGVDEPVEIPTGIDVYYAAHPDGSLLDVRVDGTVVGTIDTSMAEDGRATDGPVLAGQRWRSPQVGRAASWTLTARGGGEALVEAVSLPGHTGLEVHGVGRSGFSTRDVLDAGLALAHLEAMAARGEVPDLVVWAADTADARDPLVGPLEEAFRRTRELAPEAAIAHYVPPRHQDRGDWADLRAAMVELDEREGVIVLDGEAFVGDVSPGAGASQFAPDGVHFSVAGQARLEDGWLTVLAPPDRVGSSDAA